MTIDKLIGTVLLRVSGGTPTSDVAVKFSDVWSHIPAAVNYALNHSYWTNVGLDGDHEIPGFFLSEYTLSVIGNSVTLPKRKINIGNNRGVRYMTSTDGARIIPMPQGMTNNSRWGRMYSGVPMYREVGSEIKLFNASGISTVLVGAVTDVDDLDITDSLPIPAGYEAQVIDILVGFFTDSRFTPKDYIIDGKDIAR
jgi:hypothetical protein